jgi:hypothetical protein
MRTIWHHGTGVGYEKDGMVGWNDPRYRQLGSSLSSFRYLCQVSGNGIYLSPDFRP